jgi:hypothetical protein
MDVLLIGREWWLAWALPQLLHRAGFTVDAISGSSLMKDSKFIRRFELARKKESLIPLIKKAMQRNYDWVIVTEDGVLGEIAKSDLSVKQKLKLLPVQSKEGLYHLFSKIRLSQLLAKEGFPTPPFVVAQNLQEALIGAQKLGYPVLLKRDASGGGGGVFECKRAYDFSFIDPQIFSFPLLVQKKLVGEEIDLSALFLGSELIYFSYAKVDRVISPFGPSSIRTYIPLSQVDETIVHELRFLGKVLGAHGFTNIAAIQVDGRRFYFEADMRPNVWVDSSRYWGDDLAPYIQKWFLNRQALRFPIAPISGEPSKIQIPYFLRIGRFELLFNRYNVWKFIPKDDLILVIKLCLKRVFFFEWGRLAVRFIKWALPVKHHPKARGIKRLILNQL